MVHDPCAVPHLCVNAESLPHSQRHSPPLLRTRLLMCCDVCAARGQDKLRQLNSRNSLYLNPGVLSDSINRVPRERISNKSETRGPRGVDEIYVTGPFLQLTMLRNPAREGDPLLQSRLSASRDAVRILSNSLWRVRFFRSR